MSLLLAPTISQRLSGCSWSLTSDLLFRTITGPCGLGGLTHRAASAGLGRQGLEIRMPPRHSHEAPKGEGDKASCVAR